jgi:hypothetical protein
MAADATMTRRMSPVRRTYADHDRSGEHTTRQIVAASTLCTAIIDEERDGDTPNGR